MKDEIAPGFLIAVPQLLDRNFFRSVVFLIEHHEEGAFGVVITSSQDPERIRRACAASGVNSYVPKSDGKQALLHAVAQILRVPERKSVRLTVFFSVHGSARGRETLGKGVDLSEAGMCLEANRRYEVGVSLSLRFVLPGEKQEIQAQAVVKRLRALADETYSMGLEFTSLPEAMRERLNRYIDRSLCGN